MVGSEIYAFFKYIEYVIITALKMQYIYIYNLNSGNVGMLFKFE